MIDVKHLILSPHIVTIEYIFLVVLWIFAPEKNFRNLGIRKDYGINMFVFLVLALTVWELGILISQKAKFNGKLGFSIRLETIRVISIISIVASFILIIRSVNRGMDFITLDIWKSTDIMRSSTLAGITTLTEFCYPALIGYYYYIKNSKKIFKFDNIIIITNIIMILYRTLYMARTNLLYLIIIFFVIKMNESRKKLSLFKCISIFFVFILIYICFECLRTYNVFPESKSYSYLGWGLFRLESYFLSIIYYFFNLSNIDFTPKYGQFIFSSIYDFFNLSKNYSALYASSYNIEGMTVFTVFGEMYMSAKYLALLIVFFLSYISGILYLNFKNNKTIGLLLYPIIYVSICFMFYVNRITSGVSIIYYLGVIILLVFSNISIKLKR